MLRHYADQSARPLCILSLHPNFMSMYLVTVCLAWCLDSVLNVKGAFNQEKALVGALSVIVKTDCETD